MRVNKRRANERRNPLLAAITLAPAFRSGAPVDAGAFASAPETEVQVESGERARSPGRLDKASGLDYIQGGMLSSVLAFGGARAPAFVYLKSQFCPLAPVEPGDWLDVVVVIVVGVVVAAAGARAPGEPTRTIMMAQDGRQWLQPRKPARELISVSPYGRSLEPQRRAGKLPACPLFWPLFASI